MQIAVVDLGIGNLRSVKQALRAVAPAEEIFVSSDAAAIASADKLVLPGQGAIGTWFAALSERKLQTTVEQALSEKPVLGVCVGMQAMFDYCEEGGGMPGLGLFRGEVRHFKQFHLNKRPLESSTEQALPVLKIPQMGWNQVQQSKPHPLWQGIDDNAHFYFVHSYCANMPSADDDAIQGVSDYGHRFVSAVGAENVFAVQFHPEKSHDDGLRLLKNFTQWDGRV